MKLILAQTGQVFTQDPAISLKYLLGTNAETNPPGQWGSDSPSSLAKMGPIYLDTKWGPSGDHNKILIENMPRNVKYQTLGGVRRRTWDYKRIQIWCDAKSAINNKWLMEEEINRIVDANKLTMQSAGIDTLRMFQGFGDIEIEEVSADGTIGKGGFLARSSCIVELVYDQTLE